MDVYWHRSISELVYQLVESKLKRVGSKVASNKGRLGPRNIRQNEFAVLVLVACKAKYSPLVYQNVNQHYDHICDHHPQSHADHLLKYY